MQPTPATTTIDQAIAQTGPTTPNPTKPVLITIIGVVVGILSMAQSYFGSGHIPSAAEVAGLLSGAGVTVGSVIGFLVHHLGINKAMLARDAAALMSRSLSPTTVLALPPAGTTATPATPPAAPFTAS